MLPKRYLYRWLGRSRLLKAAPRTKRQTEDGLALLEAPRDRRGRRGRRDRHGRRGGHRGFQPRGATQTEGGGLAGKSAQAKDRLSGLRRPSRPPPRPPPSPLPEPGPDRAGGVNLAPVDEGRRQQHPR